MTHSLPDRLGHASPPSFVLANIPKTPIPAISDKALLWEFRNVPSHLLLLSLKVRIFRLYTVARVALSRKFVTVNQIQPLLNKIGALRNFIERMEPDRRIESL